MAQGHPYTDAELRRLRVDSGGPQPMEPRDVTTFPTGEAVAAGVGVALTQVAHWWASRGKTKAYTMGAVDHAVQTAMGIVTDRLEVVEAQHKDCEANVRALNADLDEIRQERVGLKAEIDRLMNGPVAGYRMRTPK